MRANAEAQGEAASAMEELKSLDRGRLHMAANEYTCLYLLPVLDRFRRLCPQIGVQIQRSLASRIPEDMLDRTVEIGIVSFRPEGDPSSRSPFTPMSWHSSSIHAIRWRGRSGWH